VFLVNLLAALNFANVFLNKKTFGKYENVTKRDQNKKRKKTFFTSMEFRNDTTRPDPTSDKVCMVEPV